MDSAGQLQRRWSPSTVLGTEVSVVHRDHKSSFCTAWHCFVGQLRFPTPLPKIFRMQGEMDISFKGDRRQLAASQRHAVAVFPFAVACCVKNPHYAQRNSTKISFSPFLKKKTFQTVISTLVQKVPETVSTAIEIFPIIFSHYGTIGLASPDPKFHVVWTSLQVIVQSRT